ncbi:PAS domain-containing protein [Rhodopseudomonas palustris]|nr:PAS domain-containing protein [Rhodopseudomonas palustris]
MSQTEADVHQELENRLRFETLLSDISVHFINLPFNLIDSAIENAQRQICQCLGLDMSVLWQWSVEKPRFLYVSHLYGPLEGPAIPEYINGEESFPWTYQKILNGETVTISTEQLPPEAAQDQATRRHYGAKSSIVIPLAAGGKPIIGVLSFDTLFQDYIWSEESVKRFQLVALVFCNALVRKHTEEVLNESTLRLDLAAKSAGAGIWELDCRTGIFWATAQARKIFGYSTDEEISMEGFERLIHAEDLSRVRQSINLAMKNRQEIDVEYRILADDGHLNGFVPRAVPILMQMENR